MYFANSRILRFVPFAFVCLALIGGWLCSAMPVAAQDLAQLIPGGFAEPHFPNPIPTPRDHLKFDVLQMRERNRVVHQIQLDRSTVNWADSVLEISVGYKEHWGPGDYYALFPTGYEKTSKSTVAFIDTEKVNFVKAFDPESESVARSSNRPEYTLYRDQEYLVISKGALKRWYFESLDGGAHWRLAKIERIMSPGQFTTLEYLDGLVVALRFPNDQKTLMTYKDRMLTRIDTPFGESAVIVRGAGGFISEITICSTETSDKNLQPQTRANKQVVFQHFQYTHNADGQIVQFISDDGSTYSAKYEHRESTKDRNKIEAYTAILQRADDGQYKYRQDDFNKTSGEWVVTRGYGDKFQGLEKSKLSQLTRFQMVNHRWSTIEFASPESEIHRTQTYDKTGNPVISISSSKKTTSRQFDETGNVIQSTTDGHVTTTGYNDYGQETRSLAADGQEQLRHYDDHARLREQIASDGTTAVYNYNSMGMLSSLSSQDKTTQLVYNDWGWLTQLTYPNGVINEWEYDVHGRPISHVVKIIRNQKEVIYSRYAVEYKAGQLFMFTQIDSSGTTTSVAEYFYDDSGRLKLIKVCEPRNDSVLHVIYKYDRLGRLTSILNPEGQNKVWTYYANGKIQSLRSWNKSEKAVVTNYSEDGKQIRSEN